MGELDKRIAQARHRMEEAEAKKRKEERSARTRRLILEGAILESVCPEAQQMTPEELQNILIEKFKTEETAGEGA